MSSQSRGASLEQSLADLFGPNKQADQAGIRGSCIRGALDDELHLHSGSFQPSRNAQRDQMLFVAIVDRVGFLTRSPLPSFSSRLANCAESTSRSIRSA